MKKLYRGLLLVLSIAGFLALNGCTAVQEQVNPTQIIKALLLIKKQLPEF